MTQDSPTSLCKAKMIYLDGRTLEGGGQLLRIAIALSALTGKPITIEHIRGNRRGKKGLGRSHLAAIKFLADISGSSVSGAGLGASTLTFRPSSHRDTVTVQSDIKIRLPTAGSVFLIFQALYPYLLHAKPSPGSSIKLTITGGTNVSFSPSFDYVSQVLVPNFARIGLPRLSVRLDRRGWATGPFNLGTVTILVDPLHSDDGSSPRFPSIDLAQYERGAVTQIDVTVLAPDDPLTSRAVGPRDKGDRKLGSGTRRQPDSGHEGGDDDSSESPGTIRQYVEQETFRRLRKGLKKLPSCIFNAPETPPPKPPTRLCNVEEGGSIVPIRIHTSEATRHLSHLYVLIVAHTSTGFNIGHDVLYGARQDGASSRRQPGVKDRHRLGETAVAAGNVVEQCVAGFLQELYDSQLQGGNMGAGESSRRPCVDELMRDQVVVFEALGAPLREQAPRHVEDERYWSLHTKTARWVCEEMMGNVNEGMKDERR